MTRLILQPGDSGREQIAAWKAARSLGIEIVSGHALQRGDVPVGDVPFCSEIMKRQGIACPYPDFYPEFLWKWMRRECVIEQNDQPAVIRTFVKSAEQFKAWPAQIVEPGEVYPNGWIYISDVVTFTQEWRYYITDGKPVTTGWYDGDNENEPAPELDIDWPTDFCGAVDFGRLDTGKIALVESHPPFACGWYGEDPELFVLWLIAGWESLSR